MATAIASNRASNASIRRKTLSLFSLPGQGRKAGSSLNRNVAFNVALTGCFVMHFYSDSPMHLLSGLDTRQCARRFGGRFKCRAGRWSGWPAFAFERGTATIAFDIHLEDRGVMDE